ncbi:MAG: hypothetical protein N3G75_04160 [Methanothrix sp.]|nr:hypothetical protein [Methanothrix sp.]MCX8207009.1 hypothetical protein [Methanothrix sp.]
MRKSAIVLVIMVAILCIFIWAQNSEKLDTVMPVAHILEISKSALAYIIGLACELLGELATRLGEGVSAIALDVFKILVEIASDLDTKLQSVLHRPII